MKDYDKICKDTMEISRICIKESYKRGFNDGMSKIIKEDAVDRICKVIEKEFGEAKADSVSLEDYEKVKTQNMELRKILRSKDGHIKKLYETIEKLRKA